jgi:hypothetical protein
MAIQTLAGVGKVFQRFLTPQRPAQDGHLLYCRVQLQPVVEALRMRAISDGFLDRVVASYGFEADCPAVLGSRFARVMIMNHETSCLEHKCPAAVARQLSSRLLSWLPLQRPDREPGSRRHAGDLLVPSCEYMLWFANLHLSAQS